MSAIVHQILGLTCETPMHAGGGSKEEVIDLPIQKEAHTNWPCVYGSSMKGALRARAETQVAMDNDLIAQAFGPTTENASDHAGSLLVSDARLILLPVRSLTSHFKLVTCPALLTRLLSDLARIGQAHILSVPSLNGTRAISSDCQNRDEVYLEEFRFSLSDWNDADVWVDLLLELIAPVPGVSRDEQKADLKKQLVLVDNDSFRHLSQSALPVLPHIAIDSDTKTVRPGALWYEENLPADTVLYTVLGCQPSRKKGNQTSASELLKAVTQQVFAQPYIQIGGNETTGMGWCRVAQPKLTQGAE
ncbi:type III-B CRISPR module RAMP protein Cmr4 [Vibrio metschnikovii]|nr:type III-B CRISPR module RAMP protein Cmr4 [Vibrio metschnikovii]